MNRALMAFIHCRTAYTASAAHGHLNKALRQAPARNILKRIYAIIRARHRNIAAIAQPVCHAAYNTAVRGENSCMRMLDALGTGMLNLNPSLLKPPGKLSKGQYAVHITVLVCLLFFGYARADKHRFGVIAARPYIRAVCLHRRYDTRKIFQCLGIIPSYKQIHRRTAGRNTYLLHAGSHNALVFIFNICRPQRRFLRIRKPKLFQRTAHILNAAAFIICTEGRRQACHNRTFRCQQHLRLFHIIAYFPCILRAYYKAIAAQNTFVAHYMSLISGKPDGFNRTMPDAFIAVPAIGFFQSQKFLHIKTPVKAVS